MTDREEKIARAAKRVYQTKGVQRTTMADIAAEAGVTRQTVYNTFSNTDAVLRAAIRLYISGQWQQITTAWSTCDTLDDKLDALFLHFAIEPWDYLHSSQEAAQLARGYNTAGQSEIEQARLEIRAEVAEIFTPFAASLEGKGTTPLTVADFISASIEGIKDIHHTREELLLALATLKASLLALTC